MGGSPGTIRAPNDAAYLVGKEAADIARSLTKDWHPRFKPLFDQMNEYETTLYRLTSSSPSGVSEWPNEPHVTVIGDAVHAMTPAQGIGASTAVRDSELLVRLLREAGGYKPGVSAAYEKEMRAYGSAAVRLSYSSATVMLGISFDEVTTPTVN